MSPITTVSFRGAGTLSVHNYVVQVQGQVSNHLSWTIGKFLVKLFVEIIRFSDLLYIFLGELLYYSENITAANTAFPRLQAENLHMERGWNNTKPCRLNYNPICR
jgi:hypothetical protein